MSELNKISIYASDAISVKNEQDAHTTGYCYEDNAWADSSERRSGAVEGIAKSIDFNTALRQATVMSKVLAEMMVLRNGDSEAYLPMSTVGIGTDYPSNETDIDNHVENLSAILNKDNFLMNGEVTTNKIADNAVTTDKINKFSVNYGKLGNILTESGNASIEKKTNGLTLRLFQSGDIGKLNLEFSGNSVTNSENIKTKFSTSKNYLVGVANSSGYNVANVNTDITTENGSIYLSNGSIFANNGTIQANSFNALSDIRMKENIKHVEQNIINNIIENTDIFSFNYINNKDKVIGVMAQDLLTYNDSIKLVDEDKDGYYSIKESKLVYVLWKYIQELNERISKLEQAK